MTLPPEAATWVIGLIVAGLLSAFYYLVRKLFADLEAGQHRIEAKVDAMQSTITAVAVLESRIERLEEALERALRIH